MSLKVLELMEGARNCVRGCANVQKGDDVLILTETTGFADPAVVEAIALASREAGAEVVMATSREYEPRVEEPTKIVQQAMLAADVLFDLCPHDAPIHCRTGRIAILEYGSKLVPVVAHSQEIMGSEWARFPMDIFWAILRNVYTQVVKGKRIRVVSPNGTDISAGLDPSQIMGFPVDASTFPGPPAKGDGMFCMFPMGVLGIQPQPPEGGTIVYDALLGIKGSLKEPVRLTVEDRWLTKVEGGAEARWFWNFIQEKKRQGIESDYFYEIMWGLNPKASIQRGLEFSQYREAELTRRAGTLHFGIGKGGRGFHWDGILLHPFSVFIDDEPLIDKGRLVALDDPEVRKIAKEFGDPDKLLTEVA